MSGQPVAQYPIVAHIRIGKVDPAPALPGLKPIEDKTKEIEKSALGIGPAFAAAAAAIAAGFAIGVTKAIELGTEMETARGNIASLFMSMEGLNEMSAAGLGKSVIQQLSEDAAKGVGDLQDYVNAYQSIFTPARQGGASLDQVRQLTRLTLTAGFGLQGQRGLINAPLDIQQALTSGAHDRTTPIVMAALRSQGISGEKFNAMNRGDQLAALMKGFSSFEGAADMMGKTVEAQSATMADAVKRFTREATAPIFEGFKRGLTGANQTISDNREALDRFSRDLASASEGLGLIVGRVVEGASEIAVGVAEAPTWDDAKQASAEFAHKLRETGADARSFGRGLGVVLAGLQGAGADLGTTAIEGLLRFREMAAQSSMVSVQAVGEALGAVGFERQFVPPTYQEAYAALGLPTSPDSQISVSEVVSGLAKADLTKSGDKKIKVELKIARVEWGNDRSLVMALEPMLEEVADRASRLGRESSLSAPLGG